jgi:hypothetical protein
MLKKFLHALMALTLGRSSLRKQGVAAASPPALRPA